eukprot:4385316-Lingulodinium_polyedra.AAC.1
MCVAAYTKQVICTGVFRATSGHGQDVTRACSGHPRGVVSATSGRGQGVSRACQSMLRACAGRVQGVSGVVP